MGVNVLDVSPGRLIAVIGGALFGAARTVAEELAAGLVARALDNSSFRQLVNVKVYQRSVRRVLTTAHSGQAAWQVHRGPVSFGDQMFGEADLSDDPREVN